MRGKVVGIGGWEFLMSWMNSGLVGVVVCVYMGGLFILNEVLSVFGFVICVEIDCGFLMGMLFWFVIKLVR